MMIHEITPKVGKYKTRKRVGRGPGSGLGKTSGRGVKGAGSRSGHQHRFHHEGGQMQFFRRLPKRGFSNFNFRTEYHVINLSALESRFAAGSEVNPEMLRKVGLLGDTTKPVKVLGEGELTKKLTVTAAKFSKAAVEKIEKAGGSVIVDA